MNITKNGKYLIYRIMDEGEGETHVAIDLVAALPSISSMVNSVGTLSIELPGAFAYRDLEVRARLEEEAVTLFDDFTVSESIDCWEENYGAPFQIVDHLSGNLYSSDSDIALLEGGDLLKLASNSDVWDGPYSCHLVFRPDEGDGAGVYLAPLVTAQRQRNGGHARFDFFSSGGRAPWASIVRKIVEFSGILCDQK